MAKYKVNFYYNDVKRDDNDGSDTAPLRTYSKITKVKADDTFAVTKTFDLKPVRSYSKLTKVKAQDIFAVFKSNMFRGQDRFVAEIYSMLTRQGIKLPSEACVFGVDVIKYSERQSKSTIVATIAGEMHTSINVTERLSKPDNDFKFDIFKYNCNDDFDAKRDDVMYRRLDLVETMVISNEDDKPVKPFRMFNGKCYLEIETLNENVLVLQQNDNNPRQFKLMTMPTKIWENIDSGLGSYVSKGGNINAKILLNNFITKENGLFDYYVEHKVRGLRRRRVFIGETVKHFKGKEYVIFDFVYNATTNNIDILYVRKNGESCSNIQFTRNYKEFLGYKQMERLKCGLVIPKPINIKRFECRCDVLLDYSRYLSVMPIFNSNSSYEDFKNKCGILNDWIDMDKGARKSEKTFYLYRV